MQTSDRPINVMNFHNTRNTIVSNDMTFIHVQKPSRRHAISSSTRLVLELNYQFYNITFSNIFRPFEFEGAPNNTTGQPYRGYLRGREAIHRDVVLLDGVHVLAIRLGGHRQDLKVGAPIRIPNFSVNRCVCRYSVVSLP